MGHHLSGGRTGSGIKALIQGCFFPAPHCYFYSLLSRLKAAWVECLSCSRAVFFPSFFQGYSGPGTLGLFSWPTQCWEQREQGKASGNISEEGKKEFWELPPSCVRFDCHGSGVRVAWFGSLFGQEKGKSSQGMNSAQRNSPKALVGRMEGRKGGKGPFLVPGVQQGLGHLSPTPHPLFLSVLKGRGALNFLTTGIFWSFPKSGEDWAELEWDGERVGEHGGICGVGNAKGCVDVLHMEHRNSGAQEALISPDVAEIQYNFCCFLWTEHSSWLNAHMDDV